MLFTSDPRGFTSGAGFFQSRPKENYQKGLSDLSACSSWRLGFLTYKQLGSQTSRTKGSEDSLPRAPRLASDSLLPCQVTVKSHQPADFSLFLQSFKSTSVYALFYIIYYVHMSLLLVYHL